MANFDRKCLDKIQAIKAKQQAFDSYFVTHHFIGKANWMWLIPMRTSEHKNIISIGIVWREDLRTFNLRTIEDFIAEVSKEHPVVSELIRSGEVLDYERYHNYLYEAKQNYSSDGWYLVSDAGDAVDPLYSTGFVMNSMQIRQISELIKRERQGKLTESAVRDFEAGYKIIKDTVQMEIAKYYEVMEDPYIAHLRMHYISTQYFFFLLPCWLSGYMSCQKGTRFVKKVMELGKMPYQSLKDLLSEASRLKGKVKAEELKNIYNLSVNWKLWKADESQLAKYFSILAWRFITYRLSLMKITKFYKLGEQIKYLSMDLVNVLFWRVVSITSRTSLREHPLFLKLINYQEIEEEFIKRDCLKEGGEELYDRVA